jgi:rare lipoprotein A
MNYLKMNEWRLGLRMVLMLCSIVLVSCTSAPRTRQIPPTNPATNPATSPTTTTTPSAPPPQSRSGGYYQDDGPGANPPDINSIPDAVPRPENLATRANRPYVVFGQSYQPMVALTPFKQRGMASWYGRKFHGQKTSNGEVYDMYGMTAAHPTLPLPSYVRVTHVRSGKSVVVRVNDRGPFLQQRVIDLSYTAAAKLGYVNAGSAEVELELITRFEGSPATVATIPTISTNPTNPAPASSAPSSPILVEATQPNERLTIETVVAANSVESPAPNNTTSASSASGIPSTTATPNTVKPNVVATGLFLQMGAFSSQDTADVAKDRMTHQFDNIVEPFRVVKDGNLFKVHLGPFTNREAAAAIAEKIKQATAFKPFTVQRP